MAIKTSRRPSISELAQATGFSQGTISRAFNNRYGVNPETREKILRAAREMGYDPVKGEAKPSEGEWQLVAPGLLNGSYAALGAALLREAEAGGAHVVVGGALRSVQQQNDIIAGIDLKQTGALIIATLSDDARPALAQLQARGLAVLVLEAPSHPGFDTVDLDLGFAIRRMVKHFTELGHRHFGYLGLVADPGENAAPSRPLEHYRSVVSEIGGATFRADFCWPHDEPGFAAAQSWNGSPPTAVLCETDDLALALSGYARRQAWKLPEELSLVAQNDSPAARAAGITALQIDWEKAARLICRAVQERCQFPAHVPRHLRIRAELILRASHSAATSPQAVHG